MRIAPPDDTVKERGWRMDRDGASMMIVAARGAAAAIPSPRNRTKRQRDELSAAFGYQTGDRMEHTIKAC